MPQTARHFIFDGAHTASDGALSDANPFYWLNEFAEENSNAAYPYIAVGRTGDIGKIADTDAPLTPDWALGAPLEAWPNLSGEDHYAVVLTPETDIQNGDPRRAATDALALVDAAQAQAPGAPVVIFEAWADPAAFLLDGQMTDTTRGLYFSYVSGAYHSWFTDFTAALQAARPEVDITLLPAASTLSDLTAIPAFDGLDAILIPSTPDDGATTRALLTGGATFADTFDMALPATSPLMTKADPALSEIYEDLAAAISTALAGDAASVEPGPDPEPTEKTGTDGNDTFTLTPALEKVDLGDGFDVVTVDAARADTNVIFNVDGSVSVQLAGDSTPAILNNVERVAFDDGTLALDTDGVAGQAYRLYQAAFDRTPDSEGLGFWIDQLDSGAVDLFGAAEFFMQSEEFADAYGTPDEVSDVLFLTLLYVNTLDRAPDDGGFIFWRDQQDEGVTRAEMMVYFSESVENTAQVAPAIADGIWYL